MKKILLMAILSFSATLQAYIGSDLNRCTTISSNSDRLDCFDTVVSYYKLHGSLNIKPSSSPEQKDATGSKTVTASKTVTLSTEDSFGKSTTELVNVDSISSKIAGKFKGWKNGAIIKLENGQKWKVISRSKGYTNLNNPKVEISRGALGSYNMRVDGLNAFAKVRRVD